MDCCEILYINGIKTHEFNCSEKWKDETRECKWCGNEFIPAEKEQDFCSIDCKHNYY